MTTRQRRVYEITRQDQIQAMSSPARLEVIDGVRVIGPCSISELAELIGRPADSLYYHVRKLLEVGLLIQAGERRTTRRDEALYITPGKRMRLPHSSEMPSKKEEQVLKTFASLLRLTDRDHRRAFEQGLAKTSGKGKNIVNGRIKGWLTPEQLAEVHGHIKAILDIFEPENTNERPRNAKLHAITLFLTPIEPKVRDRAE